MSHHQFNLVVDNDAPDGPDREHANWLADPTEDRGSVQISTAMHTGDVHLSFEGLAAAPTLDTDGWAEAVEISMRWRWCCSSISASLRSPTPGWTMHHDPLTVMTDSGLACSRRR